jgi:hypothetical protein
MDSILNFEKKGENLYYVTFIDENCNTWVAHMSTTGFQVAKIKDGFQKKGYDMVMIEEFEDALRQNIDYENSMDDDD